MSEDYDAEKLEAFEHVVKAFAGLAFGGWLRRACPRCKEIDGKPDYKASLGYNTQTGGFNCFKCGMKGSLPYAWKQKLELADPSDYASTAGAPQTKPVMEMPDQFIPIFSGEGEHISAFDSARSYVIRPKTEVINGVKGRGMSWETAEAMGIGISLSGHTTISLTKGAKWPPLKNRVIIPIIDHEDPNESWKGWVARDFVAPKPMLPYRYPKGMDREELLFNEKALWVETDEPCLITEGVFDTTLIYPDAVSCMGKPLDSHLPRFIRAKRPLVVCLDGDAWEEGWALSMTLRHLGLRSGSIHLPPKTDPDEVDPSWLKRSAKASLSRLI